MGQNTLAISEIAQVNIKSFTLSKELISTDFFNKIKLKPVSRLIIVSLCSMYNPKLGYSFPGLEKLAKCSGGYSEKQTKAGLKELSEKGLIVRTDKKIYFTRNFYELLEVIEKMEDTSTEMEDTSTEMEDTSKNTSGKTTLYPNNNNYLPPLDFPPNREITDNKNNVRNKIYFFESHKQKKSCSEKTKELIQEYKSIEKRSPLDFTKEQAIEYLNNLGKFAKTTQFARELIKKWNLEKNF